MDIPGMADSWLRLSSLGESPVAGVSGGFGSSMDVLYSFEINQKIADTAIHCC